MNRNAVQYKREVIAMLSVWYTAQGCMTQLAPIPLSGDVAPPLYHYRLQSTLPLLGMALNWKVLSGSEPIVHQQLITCK